MKKKSVINNKYKIAFTLIELLVVIAIIGILSGLIIVGMSSSTNAARVAKAQIFSSSLRSSLLMNLVSDWKLDQVDAPVAGKTPDSWGSNHCTLSGATLPTLQSTGCVYGNCFSFNGTTSYLDCGNAASLDITTAITLSAWIKTTSNITQVIAEKNPGATNGYGIYTISGQFSGRLYPNPINSTTVVNDNNWHYVLMSNENITNGWNLYVDGVNVTKQNGVAIITNTNLFLIGIRTGNSLPFNGLIDDVRLYNVAIPSSMVIENYYVGLSNLLKNGGMSFDEYNERIKGLANR